MATSGSGSNDFQSPPIVKCLRLRPEVEIVLNTRMTVVQQFNMLWTEIFSDIIVDPNDDGSSGDGVSTLLSLN